MFLRPTVNVSYDLRRSGLDLIGPRFVPTVGLVDLRSREIYFLPTRIWMEAHINKAPHACLVGLAGQTEASPNLLLHLPFVVILHDPETTTRGDLVQRTWRWHSWGGDDVEAFVFAGRQTIKWTYLRCTVSVQDFAILRVQRARKDLPRTHAAEGRGTNQRK